MKEDLLDTLPSRLELHKLLNAKSPRIKYKPPAEKTWNGTSTCANCGATRYITFISSTSESKAHKEFIEIEQTSLCPDCDSSADGWSSQDQIASEIRRRYKMMQEHLAAIDPANGRCSLCSSVKLHANTYHDSRYSFMLGWRIECLYKPMIEQGKLWEWVPSNTKPSQLWKVLLNKEKELMGG